MTVLVAAAGVPRPNKSNGLECQKASRGSFDPQRLSGAVSNPVLVKAAAPRRRRHLMQGSSGGTRGRVVAPPKKQPGWLK
jgi:hypothetical protein